MLTINDDDTGAAHSFTINHTGAGATGAGLRINATTGEALIASGGDVYHAGGQTSSTVYGDDASVSAAQCTALGDTAVCTGGNCVAVGFDAEGAVSDTIVGMRAGAWSGTSSGRNTMIGSFCHSTATGLTDSVCIGYNNKNKHSDTIIISSTVAAIETTAAGQALIATDVLSDVYIGQGVTDTTPENITIQPTGESGTDQNGVYLNLAGGKGTGAGTPGELRLSTPAAGASGTTLQSQVLRYTIDSLGDLIAEGTNQDLVFQGGDTSAFSIRDTQSDTFLSFDSTNDAATWGQEVNHQAAHTTAGQWWVKGNGSATSVTVQGTYYDVTGLTCTEDELRNMTSATDCKIDPDTNYAGSYLVSCAASVSAGASDVIGVSIGVDGSQQAKCQQTTTLDASGNVEAVPVTCVLTLSAGNELSLMVANETDTDNITVDDLTCTAWML
jgi:hypothetical protein